MGKPYLPFSIECNESVFTQRSAIKANKQNQEFPNTPCFPFHFHRSMKPYLDTSNYKASPVTHCFIGPSHNGLTKTLIKMSKMCAMSLSSSAVTVSILGCDCTLRLLKPSLVFEEASHAGSAMWRG